MVDEIDALVGETLLGVPRHLRAGYESARGAFRRAWFSAGCGTCGTAASDRRGNRQSSGAAAPSTSGPTWYTADGGSLLVDKMLAGFQEFFREHSEHWLERFEYREAGRRLLLQAFLQRIVNSGGPMEREYGLCRMRTDLLIVWPRGEGRGATPVRERGKTQRVVMECKVLRKGPGETRREGVRQTRAYMERCGAGEGHRVIFDRHADRSWQDKVYGARDTEGGAPVMVWG